MMRQGVRFRQARFPLGSGAIMALLAAGLPPTKICAAKGSRGQESERERQAIIAVTQPRVHLVRQAPDIPAYRTAAPTPCTPPCVSFPAVTHRGENRSTSARRNCMISSRGPAGRQS
jgi:hypothetical protein